MQANATDTDIIELVLKGDTGAYAVIVDRYRSFVFTLTLRYVRNREDAEEVAQDVFVKAYRSLANFKGSSKFSTWLYTVVTTTCLSFLRKKRTEVHSLDDDRFAGTAEGIDGGILANSFEQKDRQQVVSMAIQLLSAEDAQILTLFYNAEQSLEEISKILGKEQNTVKVQLHRARGRLKEKIEKNFRAELKDLQ